MMKKLTQTLAELLGKHKRAAALGMVLLLAVLTGLLAYKVAQMDVIRFEKTDDSFIIEITWNLHKRVSDDEAS